MFEEVVNLDGPVGEEVVVPAIANQQQRTAIMWNSVMSSFVLRRMCELISTRVRTDKGFKEVYLNQVAKALHEFTGNEVSGTQVYNHLRKWRQRWMRVNKLRELSGVLWDEDNCMITLEEEHYKGHVKVCCVWQFILFVFMHFCLFIYLCIHSRITLRMPST
jgi:hypothetical protein